MKSMTGECYIWPSWSTNCEKMTRAAISSIIFLRVLPPRIQLIPLTIEWLLLASKRSRRKVHNRLHWGLKRASSNIWRNVGTCAVTELSRLWHYSVSIVSSIISSIRVVVCSWWWATVANGISWGVWGQDRLITFTSFARSKIVQQASLHAYSPGCLADQNYTRKHSQPASLA